MQTQITTDRLNRLNQVLDSRTRKIVVVLDQIDHLYNMAAIARSCDAFGIQNVHVIQPYIQNNHRSTNIMLQQDQPQTETISGSKPKPLAQTLIDDHDHDHDLQDLNENNTNEKLGRKKWLQMYHEMALTDIDADENQRKEMHRVDDIETLQAARRLTRFKAVLAHPSLRRVSKGVDKWLTWHLHSSVKECVDALHKSGYKVLVSNVHPHATPIDRLPCLNETCANHQEFHKKTEPSHPPSLESSSSVPQDKFALVFGNEVNGVSQDFISQADAFFTLPMVGFVESFNVSVAVAVALAITTVMLRPRVHTDRSHSQSDPITTTAAISTNNVPFTSLSSNYLLTNKEKADLLKDWISSLSLPVAEDVDNSSDTRDLSRKTKRKNNLHTKSSVTFFDGGHEAALLKHGPFSSSKQPQFSSNDYDNGNNAANMKNLFCLERDTGLRFDEYMQRRRNGCQGSLNIQLRSKHFVISAAGVLSLFTARGLRTNTPKIYLRLYENLFHDIQKRFAVYFDEKDYAINPDDSMQTPNAGDENILPLFSYLETAMQQLYIYDSSISNEPLLHKNWDKILCTFREMLGRVTIQDMLLVLCRICDVDYDLFVSGILKGNEHKDIQDILRSWFLQQDERLIHSWALRDTMMPPEDDRDFDRDLDPQYGMQVLEHMKRLFITESKPGLRSESERNLFQMWLRLEHGGWNATELHRNAWRRRAAHGLHFRKREQTINWCRSYEGMLVGSFQMGSLGFRKKGAGEMTELQRIQRGVACVMVQMVSGLVRGLGTTEL